MPFAGGAVDAQISDLTVPSHQLALHLSLGVKALPGKAAAFYISHAAPVLVLGLEPVRPASLGGESPVAGIGGEHRVDHQFTRPEVVVRDQRLGVIHHHLLRHPGPDTEPLLQGLQPVAQPLVAEHLAADALGT